MCNGNSVLMHAQYIFCPRKSRGIHVLLLKRTIATIDFPIRQPFDSAAPPHRSQFSKIVDESRSGSAEELESECETYSRIKEITIARERNETIIPIVPFLSLLQRDKSRGIPASISSR